MKFEVYEDDAGEHRFRLKADNHEVIAVSSEGYTTRRSALKAIRLISHTNPNTRLVINPDDAPRRTITTAGLITETGTLD